MSCLHIFHRKHSYGGNKVVTVIPAEISKLLVADFSKPDSQISIHHTFQIGTHHGDNAGVSRCKFIHNIHPIGYILCFAELSRYP